MKISKKKSKLSKAQLKKLAEAKARGKQKPTGKPVAKPAIDPMLGYDSRGAQPQPAPDQGPLVM